MNGDISVALIGPLAALEGHLKQARELLKKFDRMSVAYRFLFHRTIARDLKAINRAISRNMEAHRSAGESVGWLVQEERAKATAQGWQEVKERMRRLQLGSVSSTSTSSSSSLPCSESSTLNDLDAEELAQQRHEVIPAEISALME
ncbi:hypothetical protein KFL_005550010, partial [Klebsormidium nitens]